jgi:pyruvate/2-oxoglutarate dehydrogenase complex dihydrolipoamide dehydrogenase (E3) component
MIFESYVTISQGEIEALAIGWFHIACSLIPPLARVGLSEGEAERQGVIARVARLPMDSVLGAQATDQREGFMKALVGDSDDRIRGFTMIGAAAGEVMAAVQTAMLAGLSYSSLADADFAHPTMAEGLGMLFSNVPPRVVPQTKRKIAYRERGSWA